MEQRTQSIERRLRVVEQTLRNTNQRLQEIDTRDCREIFQGLCHVRKENGILYLKHREQPLTTADDDYREYRDHKNHVSKTVHSINLQSLLGVTLHLYDTEFDRWIGKQQGISLVEFVQGMYGVSIQQGKRIVNAEGIILEVVNARLRIVLCTPDTRTMHDSFENGFTSRLKASPVTSGVFDILKLTPEDSFEDLFTRFIAMVDDTEYLRSNPLVHVAEGMKVVMCEYYQFRKHLPQCPLESCPRCGTAAPWSLPRNAIRNMRMAAALGQNRTYSTSTRPIPTSTRLFSTSIRLFSTSTGSYRPISPRPLTIVRPRSYLRMSVPSVSLAKGLSAVGFKALKSFKR
ncbi:hypothetical protein MMC30_007714 [Trapelia coarctata]|nr:hypothetical protein [Trapelia coarctata]